MLDSIRKHSDSVVVKVFLCVLAVGFVFGFGIYDVIRKVLGRDYVVKVGNVKVSPQEFKIEKARRLAMLNARGRENIDEKAVTVEILRQMIWENIINLAAKDYGFLVSDNTLKRYINGMDIFKNKDGSFNANALRGFLQKIQMPEPAFLEYATREIRTSLIKSPMAYVSPMRELDDYIAVKNEKRSVKFIEVKFASVKVEQQPTQEDLEEFYAKNSDQFTVDETRAFKILKIDESELGKDIKVSDDEIREAYDFSPEKDTRTFEEMKDELEADLKRDKLESAKSEFVRKVEDEVTITGDADAVAKQFHLQVSEIPDIFVDGSGEGSAALKSLPYKNEVITIAFSLDDGADSSFSESLNEKKETVLWLVHIEKITPKHRAQFKQVEKKVETAWKNKQKRDAAFELAQKIVEEINGGAKFEEIVKKNGHKSKTTELFAIDAKADDIKSDKELIESIQNKAFALNKNEATFVEIGESFFVYELDKISITDADKNAEGQDTNIHELVAAKAEDLFQELVGYLAKEYGVNVNYDMLKEINEEIDPNQKIY